MGKFITANGLKLHYLDHPGPEPALILMPGLTANAHSFDGYIEAGLSPARRVLALDLRGRGLSDKPATGYSMADHAADIIGFMDALEIEQAFLGGHSFGGLLTIYLGATHPERFPRLVVIDAAASMHPNTMELIKPSVERLGQVLPSWESYLEAMKNLPFYHDWWDPLIENYYRADVAINPDGSVTPQARPEAIIAAAGAVMMENWHQHLAALRQPLLLVNAPGPFGLPGTAPVLPKELALETVNAVADGRYVEVPGNHMTMLFGPGAEKTVAAILSFLNSD